jgi:hypothetical protein
MAEKRGGGKTYQNLARGSKQPRPCEKSPALKWLAEMKEMAQSEMRVDKKGNKALRNQNSAQLAPLSQLIGSSSIRHLHFGKSRRTSRIFS